MKLVIDSVSFGKVPYGPGNGTSSIAIKFGEAEGDYTYEEPKPAEGMEDHKFTKEETAAHGLLLDVLAKIKDAKLENQWGEVLVAKSYVYFIGDVIAAPEHREVAALFLDLVDKCALEIQKKVVDENVTDEKKKAEIFKRGLHAPLTVFVSTCKYFTGKSEMYERFRVNLCKITLEEGKESNPMALVEVQNHCFSTLIFDMDAASFESKKEYYETKFKKEDVITVSSDRVFVVDHSGSDEIAKFSLEEGFRLNRALDYTDKSIVLDM